MSHKCKSMVETVQTFNRVCMEKDAACSCTYTLTFQRLCYECVWFTFPQSWAKIPHDSNFKLYLCQRGQTLPIPASSQCSDISDLGGSYLLHVYRWILYLTVLVRRNTITWSNTQKSRFRLRKAKSQAYIGRLRENKTQMINPVITQQPKLLCSHILLLSSLTKREREMRVLRGRPKEFPGINIWKPASPKWDGCLKTHDGCISIEATAEILIWQANGTLQTHKPAVYSIQNLDSRSCKFSVTLQRHMTLSEDSRRDKQCFPVNWFKLVCHWKKAQV